MLFLCVYQLSFFSLRCQSVDSPVQVGDFADVADAEDFHQHACGAWGKAAVGRAAIFEEIEVAFKRFDLKSFFFDLLFEPVVTVFPLGAAGDLQPFEQQVEALGEFGVGLQPHAVESPRRCRPIVDKDKLVAVFVLHILGYTPFFFGAEVFTAVIGDAHTGQNGLRFGERQAGKGRLRDDDFLII